MGELICNNGLTTRLITFHRGLVRIAAIHDEEWIEDGGVGDLEALLRLWQNAPPADIFTFTCPLPDSDRSYSFHFDWDNVAVVKTIDLAHWWQSLPQETRKNVRRSQRRGVAVTPTTFDDDLARGISNIYNETPIRQGRKFWHYGKSFEEVKAANNTYPERSEFIGAFFNSELIGFVKFVKVNNVARIMQILSKDSHADKRPTNALLAKTVEICCQKNISHLVYGKYVYGKKQNSPVTEFKRRNGFERLDFPRYYVPLTRRGSVAIRYGLYRGMNELVPETIMEFFLTTRAAIYRRRLKGATRSVKTASSNSTPQCSSPVV